MNCTIWMVWHKDGSYLKGKTFDNASDAADAFKDLQVAANLNGFTEFYYTVLPEGVTPD